MTALTGFIVPKCKVYGNGFFSKKANDPDEFVQDMRELKKSLYDPVIAARKAELDAIKTKKLWQFDLSTCQMENGIVRLHRISKYKMNKNLDDDTAVISSRKFTGDKRKIYHRNINGIRVDENSLAIIKSRVKITKNDGLIKITKRN